MGNEAIARGGAESGVGLVTGYPGTPATEIVTSYLEYPWIHVEWAANEKVALEMSLGASLCNMRAMTAMKHNGTNVALDFLMHLNFTGIVGGMVLVSADDPGGLSSQNEEDTRVILREYAHLPVFDPSNGAEAKRMVKDAYDLSEKTQLCFALRPVMRVCHSRSIVEYEPPQKPRKTNFVDDRSRFVMSAVEVKEFGGVKRPQVRHRWLNEKQELLKGIVEASPYNAMEDGDERIGLIGCGIAYSYIKEALQLTDKRYPTLKLCTLPIPENKIASFAKDLDTIAVFEELEPLVEGLVKQVLFDRAIETKVVGRSGFLPSEGEMSTQVIAEAVRKLDPTARFKSRAMGDPDLRVPVRTRTQCVGCGYRTLLHAIKLVSRKHKAIVTGDIGCHDAGAFEPLSLQSTIYCMGSSVPIAQGMSMSGINRPLFSIIGDSTFFHNGLLGLINAVHHNANVVVILCDNGTTAMTGFQPHPGSKLNIRGEASPSVDAIKIGKALGIPTRIIDPYDIKGVKRTLEEAVNDGGVSLLISRAPCLLQASKNNVKLFETRIVHVESDKCTGCRVCINYFACPAITVSGKKAQVDQLTCVGCGFCIEVCPLGAIIAE
jgi:indolepyruvate ferredoxin oxidoreductase alpha subunit